MKKVLKAILYFFCTILVILLGLIIFLYVYYSILEKKQIKQERILESRSKVFEIPPYSISGSEKSRGNINLPEEKSQLEAIKESGNRYLKENKRLWLLRNKPGGYDRSTAALNIPLSQVNDRLILLDKSPDARGLNRFLEKIGTAGVVLYLRLS